jgi:hypothetical protein
VKTFFQVLWFFAPVIVLLACIYILGLIVMGDYVRSWFP